MTIVITGGKLRGLRLRIDTGMPEKSGRGKQKGVRSADQVIRPSQALFRRSLFDLLMHRHTFPNLDGAHFGDLCAGSGAVGIEAFSRGATACCFIDLPIHRNVLEDNLKKAGVLKQSEIQCLSVLNFRGSRNGPLTHIFADPPYRSHKTNDSANDRESEVGHLAQALLEHLAEQADNPQYLRADGVILFQRSPRQDLRLPDGLTLLEERRQGNAILMILAPKTR